MVYDKNRIILSIYMIFVVYYSSPVPVFECLLIFVLINAFVHVAMLLKMVQ